MSEPSETQPVTSAAAPALPKQGLLKTLEIDTRLLGMIGAFVGICLVFQWMTGEGNIVTRFFEGRFLTPRNIFNLTIQTVSVGIMATGMVFVIVTRHIDLGVGALLATCSAVMAMMQTRWLPETFGMSLDSVWLPWITIAAGIAVGAVIGAWQGWLIGYTGVPAFIVTLGGLLIWRNVAWQITDGQTISLFNETFRFFGGVNGTLGGFWSIVIGIVASAVAVFAILNSRRQKAAHGFPVKPMWAEWTVIGIVVTLIMGFVLILASYGLPERVIARDFAELGCESADTCNVVYGLPASVLLLLAVALVMTLIATRTRLGRYIFATGGNPDAAELSGINTRTLTIKVFAIMGVLCAISAVVASARLTSHTNDIGILDELRVIAAAVIGGTALAGGVGTIYGAILGALIMQSLQSGMAMVGVDAPMQNIVVGTVLVFAVMIDIAYRNANRRPYILTAIPVQLAVALFFFLDQPLEGESWLGYGLALAIPVALTLYSYVHYSRKGAFK